MTIKFLTDSEGITNYFWLLGETFGPSSSVARGSTRSVLRDDEDDDNYSGVRCDARAHHAALIELNKLFARFPISFARSLGISA